MKLKVIFSIFVLLFLVREDIKALQENPNQVTPAGDKTFIPIEKPDAEKWSDCSAVKPVERANDGSTTWTCFSEKQKKRFEFIYRSIHSSCNPVVNAKDPRDDYQHFLCEEQWEMMVRPDKKHE